VKPLAGADPADQQSSCNSDGPSMPSADAERLAGLSSRRLTSEEASTWRCRRTYHGHGEGSDPHGDSGHFDWMSNPQRRPRRSGEQPIKWDFGGRLFGATRRLWQNLKSTRRMNDGDGSGMHQQGGRRDFETRREQEGVPQNHGLPMVLSGPRCRIPASPRWPRAVEGARVAHLARRDSADDGSIRRNG